jgi:hypothetical protein
MKKANRAAEVAVAEKTVGPMFQDLGSCSEVKRLLT